MCMMVRESEDVQMQQSGICNLLGLKLAGLLMLWEPGRADAGLTTAARFLRFYYPLSIIISIYPTTRNRN